jgi:hypothetical protein
VQIDTVIATHMATIVDPDSERRCNPRRSHPRPLGSGRCSIASARATTTKPRSRSTCNGNRFTRKDQGSESPASSSCGNCGRCSTATRSHSARA